MFRIHSNETIAPGIFRMMVEAGPAALKAMAGQFVIVRIDEMGERIPLTIADIKDNAIIIVYQAIGVTTYRLSCKKKNESIADIVGPLGHATDIKKIGTVSCVGGGVGIAELYPVCRGYKLAGNRVITIIGARSRELLIFKKELSAYSDEVFVMTDDGSEGKKGFVSDMLKDIINTGKGLDLVYAVGPAVMMEAVSELTRPYGIRTLVSLNTVLVDGTGMCGSCRIDVGGVTKFACVDGPEFDGHKVNFKELKFRQGLFKEQENHACKIRGIVK